MDQNKRDWFKQKTNERLIHIEKQVAELRLFVDQHGVPPWLDPVSMITDIIELRKLHDDYSHSVQIEAIKNRK